MEYYAFFTVRANKKIEPGFNLASARAQIMSIIQLHCLQCDLHLRSGTCESQIQNAQMETSRRRK